MGLCNCTQKSESVDPSLMFPTTKLGTFCRAASQFRHFISDEKDSKYPVEEGRYHLYINLACPWANGVLVTIHLKGLEHAISWSTTQPEWGLVDEDTNKSGWVFNEDEGTDLAQAIDPVNGLSDMRQIYNLAEPGYEGRYTVPVL